MRRLFITLKAILTKVAGLAGGLLVGTFLGIGYPIAWRMHHAVLPHLFLALAALCLLSIFAGLLYSRFFAHFILVPLSWLASSGNGDDALGEGSEAATPLMAHFLYFFAIPLMFAGGFFGFGAVYGAGLAALCAFGVILYCTEFKTKRTKLR